MEEVVVQGDISSNILILRGNQVILDRDLAILYNVETKVLNQAVKRNIDGFPSDFIFQLNDKEKNELVTDCDRFKKLKHSTVNPYAFTEEGIYMLATVLNSKVAVQTNMAIIRTFKKVLNELIASYEVVDAKVMGFLK